MAKGTGRKEGLPKGTLPKAQSTNSKSAEKPILVMRGFSSSGKSLTASAKVTRKVWWSGGVVKTDLQGLILYKTG